jgi:hypothetical protein
MQVIALVIALVGWRTPKALDMAPDVAHRRNR